VTKANSQQFSIQARHDSGDFRAEVSSFGAALTGFWVGETEIVGDPESLGLPSGYVGSVLAPWPSRIEGGSWQLNGVTKTLEINEPARNNALHGLVANLDWQLREQRASEIVLGYLLEPSAGYPFALDLAISYALDENGLSVTLRVKNLSAQPAPFAVAFHPYFRVHQNSTLLETNCVSALELNANLIPTGSMLGLADLGFDAIENSEFARLPAVEAELDDCLVGPGSPISTRLRSNGFSTVVWQDSSLGYCVMYSGKLTGDDRLGYIAIEPQSAPANAFNSGIDLVTVVPGEASEFGWGVRVS
jgi:aldose 1-epimerase